MIESTFEILDNGIYKAYWKSIQPAELEAYAKWFMSNYEGLPPNSTVRVLHDYRETDTPAFSRLREVMSSYKLRNDVTLRIAHIYSDFLYPLIMQNVTLVAGVSANRKFFKPSEETSAIQWLLES